MHKKLDIYIYLFMFNYVLCLSCSNSAKLLI